MGFGTISRGELKNDGAKKIPNGSGLGKD